MSATLTDIKTECAGRWSSVLMNIGIDSAFLSGKHGPCPVCSGKDRFRWDRKKEMAYCSGCGHKSPLDLAIAYLGRPFKETAAEIRQILGVTTMEPVKQGTTDEEIAKNTARLKAIYDARKMLDGSDIASRYLASRGLRVAPEQDVFYVDSADYWYQDDSKKWCKSSYPAMVAVFRDIERKTVSYHMTYLSADKGKAPVDSPKKIMPTIRPMQGAAIQLFKPVNGLIAIAEGIETSLAVSMDTGLPTWSAGNAANMAAMQVPDEITKVVIYADMDESFTGQQAAYTLAKRLKSQGIAVHVVVLMGDEQHTDAGTGGDFLDYCIRERHAFQRSASVAR